MIENEDLHKQVMRRLDELDIERSTWVPDWQELSRMLLPRSGRFFDEKRNKGGRRSGKIHDSTGTRAARTLSSGMQAGITSPARPWFRLQASDKTLMQSHAVKAWFADATRLLQAIFARSNTYGTLHSSYEEDGVFGTSVFITDDNFDSVIHHTGLTIGEYWVATDHQGKPNTLIRSFTKPVVQAVADFGLDAVSDTTRDHYKMGRLNAEVPVVHIIEPRADRDPKALGARNAKWRSVYIERNRRVILRDSGYDEFPAVISRWHTVNGDVYGTGPAMDALGDVLQLQHQQFRKGQAIDYMVKPPLQVPSGTQRHSVDLLPGGISSVDMSSASGGAKPMFESRLDLQHLLLDIQDVRQRLRESFYADLFLMLASQPMAGSKMTAAEVAERHEEKLLMLGPVLERQHNEKLGPLVERTFMRCMRVGLLPPPPPELHGAELNVEFVSMLAQAQRAVQTTSVDRFVMSLGQIAAMKPEVIDKFDADRWAEVYADDLGVDPDLIVAGPQVALIRQERAQAQQAQAQAEQAAQMSQTAKNLGSASTSGGNALSDLMSAFSGYSIPGASR